MALRPKLPNNMVNMQKGPRRGDRQDPANSNFNSIYSYARDPDKFPKPSTEGYNRQRNTNIYPRSNERNSHLNNEHTHNGQSVNSNASAYDVINEANMRIPTVKSTGSQNVIEEVNMSRPTVKSKGSQRRYHPASRILIVSIVVSVLVAMGLVGYFIYHFRNKQDNIEDGGNTTHCTECVIPDTLTIVPTETTTYVSGSSASITCTAANSSGWHTMNFVRADVLNTSLVEPLLFATKVDGKLKIEKPHGGMTFKVEHTVLKDGLTMRLIFDQIQCSDAGIYLCEIIFGDINGIAEVNTTITTIHEIDVSTSVPLITAPTFSYQGNEIDVNCTGSIGRDETGTQLGNMSFRIKYKDERIAEYIQYANKSTPIDCRFNEMITHTILVTNEMDGADLQCVTITADAILLSSVTLSVATTTVRLTASSHMFTIGEVSNITIELENILDWDTIETSKVCHDRRIVIGRIRNYQNITNSSLEDEHLSFSDTHLTEADASTVLHFNNVTCGDACGEEGEVDYSCAVRIGETWINGSVTIKFQSAPEAPLLTTDMFYRDEEAVITCIGNVGQPEREMAMTENGTSIPIEELTSFQSLPDNETCENVKTIQYAFHVTDDKEGIVYVCETRSDSGAMSSNAVTVHVSDPILYFSEAKQTADIGNSTSIKCILTITTNMSSVVVSKGESGLCTVTGPWKGICERSGFTAEGTLSEDNATFNTTITLKSVSCDDEGVYMCTATGLVNATTSMTLAVTGSPKEPLLVLPTTLVENQDLLWEDYLKCTAYVGYPTNGNTLKVLIPGSESIQADTASDTCSQDASIKQNEIKFSSDQNGSVIRCVIVNKHGDIIEKVEKTLLLLKNVCFDIDKKPYKPHQYNCKRYTRCIDELMHDMACGIGTCGTTTPTADDGLVCSSSYCSGCD